MKPNIRPLVLTVTEAGNLLGVSRSTAYELVRSGELESIKLRRRVVVPVRTLADLLGITVNDVWRVLEDGSPRRPVYVTPLPLPADVTRPS